MQLKMRVASEADLSLAVCARLVGLRLLSLGGEGTLLRLGWLSLLRADCGNSGCRLDISLDYFFPNDQLVWIAIDGVFPLSIVLH